MDEMRIFEEEANQDQARLEAEAREKAARRRQAIVDRVNGFIREAVEARESSGVESRWREDLTFYYGDPDVTATITGIIDAAQAAEAKQRATGRDGERQTRSRITINITRPKTNAAYARISDMLLPVDDRNFAIEHTPVPMVPVAIDPGSDPNRLVATQGGGVSTSAQEIARKTEIARAAAKLMQDVIDDNLVECDYNSQCRKVIFDACLLGTGVQAGPVAAMQRNAAWVKKTVQGGADVWVEEVSEVIVPESRHVPLWNVYPDPSANGVVERMNYMVEVDEMNAKALRDLRDQPGYIKENIDSCLRSRPAAIRRARTEQRLVSGSYQPKDGELYEFAIVTCYLTRGDLYDIGYERCGPTEAEASDERELWRGDHKTACVVVCCGAPIKVFVSPTQGSLGYDFFCYEEVHGQPFGLGIPALIRNPQRVVSSSWRMVMDNAAYCVGGQVVYDDACIEPVDGTSALYGGKAWRIKPSIVGDRPKVEDVFRVYNMEMHLGELEKIIALAMKFGEDETSLPSLLEGNRGAAPDTVGGMTLLMNSANVVLKALAKRFDDKITKPHIGRYYQWHMRHSSRTEIKGDMRVVARGSTHLVIRDLERQSLVGFMQYSVMPQYAPFFKTGGYSALRKVAEANHISADDVLVSEEEAPQVFKRMQDMAAQQSQAGGGADAAKERIEQQRLDFQAKENELDRAHKERMLQMQIDLKMMELAEKRGVTVEQIRSSLASQVIKQTHEDKMQVREAGIKAAMGSGL